MGLDIQLQIDHDNKKWYDKYGKLKIEHIERYLQDNNFVEDEIGVWRDTGDDKSYQFDNGNIEDLKDTGNCIIVYIG